jgi:protocatechuate 3,4-dioxygenase, beta subunit
MKNYLLSSLLIILSTAACSQSSNNVVAENPVGDHCEGCDAVLEFGKRRLNTVDTLPDFNERGQKLLVTGTIYTRDGKTPAKDVILYIYHTNQEGVYATKGNETGWGKRHGYLRSWIKTNADGHYSFYTLRPASYPEGKNPAHIHAVIKEPGLIPYWIDEYLFDDDPFLTDEERNHQQKRGGSGIVKITVGNDGLAIMKRDLVLGLNVPHYDDKRSRN